MRPLPRRSGSFSREELTKYLLHASAICSKLGLAFLHAFQEVTFRKPTFCHSCNGFVSTGPVSTLGSRLPLGQFFFFLGGGDFQKCSSVRYSTEFI